MSFWKHVTEAARVLNPLAGASHDYEPAQETSRTERSVFVTAESYADAAALVDGQTQMGNDPIRIIHHGGKKWEIRYPGS